MSQKIKVIHGVSQISGGVQGVTQTSGRCTRIMYQKSEDVQVMSVEDQDVQWAFQKSGCVQAVSQDFQQSKGYTRYVSKSGGGVFQKSKGV